MGHKLQEAIGREVSNSWAMNSYFETYTRNSGVDDKELKKHLKLIWWYLFGKYVGEGHSFFNFQRGPYEKFLGNPCRH